MAYWTVDFMSRTGIHYQIKIDGASGQTDIPLTPAEDPFMTEEEGKEDLFIPIKTQSGYINVITDDINLIKTIIPITGGTRTVVVNKILQNSTQTVWQGYVQPRLLSIKIWRGKQKIQIPVECPLSALKYRTFATSQIYMNVAALLYMTLGSSFTNFYFQGECLSNYEQDAYMRSWLMKYVSTTLFTSQNFTHYQVLEAVCIFYGWAARSVNSNIYILACRNIDNIGSTRITVLTNQQLSSESTGQSVSESYTDFDQTDLIAAAIADDKTALVMTEGIRGANVTCSLKLFNTVINSTDIDIAEAINDGQLDPSWVNTSYSEEEWQVDRGYYDYVTNVHVGPANEGWTINSYNTRYILNKNGSNNSTDWTYEIEIRTDYWYGYYIDDPSVVRVIGSYKGWTKILSDQEFTFNEGTLTITPKRPSKYNRVEFDIKIGNMTFVPDTNSWTSGQGGHPLYIDESNESVDVPIPAGGLSGKIQLYFYIDTIFYSYISGFELNFKSKETQEINSDITEIGHSAASNQLFSGEKSVESQLCVRERYVQSSMNFMLDHDARTPLTGIYDYIDEYSQKFNPLQRLADNMAQEMNTVGELYKINVRRELMNDEIDPLTLIYDEHLDEMLYPVSIDRDWNDDVLRLKLIKRLMSGQ